MDEKQADQAGTKKQAEAPISKGEQAAMESEPERRPDDEEVDTAAEQRPPSDS
jgi:hypothetical protein